MNITGTHRVSSSTDHFQLIGANKHERWVLRNESQSFGQRVPCFLKCFLWLCSFLQIYLISSTLTLLAADLQIIRRPEESALKSVHYDNVIYSRSTKRRHLVNFALSWHSVFSSCNLNNQSFPAQYWEKLSTAWSLDALWRPAWKTYQVILSWLMTGPSMSEYNLQSSGSRFLCLLLWKEAQAQVENAILQKGKGSMSHVAVLQSYTV